MAIEATYRTLLTEDYLKSELQKGIAVSALDLQEQANTLLETLDLSVPQFTAEDYYVSLRENASVSKFINTFTEIRQDLRALYNEMLTLTRVSMDAYERWAIEAEFIEKKLVDLEDRIENLLILTQDTEGYFSFVNDNFSDLEKVDLDLSTIRLNLDTGMVTMKPASLATNRIFLNDIDRKRDVSFKVRTTTDFILRRDLPDTQVADLFHQTSKVWWTIIQMKKVRPVTCELTVRLSSDDPVDVSRIDIHLHDSSQSSPIQITPLYSTDNVNFTQLPTNTFTQEVRSSATFSFSTVQANWVKFLLTKKGPDPTLSRNSFDYQFGFKAIEFYDEGFTVGDAQSLISKPLYVLKDDGTPLEFEKLVLTACERVEENTNIRYYVTTGDDPDLPVDDDTIWVPISPDTRESPLFPVVLAVGDTELREYGDDEICKVSYDSSASEPYISPAQSFQLLEDDGSGGIDDTATTANDRRYTFLNSNDRILNYQVKDNISINPATLQILRNLGEQALTDIPGNKVRNVLRGWGFDDPWYSCVVEVLNPEGIEMNVGDQVIIIDDIRYTGLVKKTVLTGKTSKTTGIHTIKVHKNNWKYVNQDLSGVSPTIMLDTIKARDPLYPYNHKLLVEGFSYPSNYPDTDEKVYAGADLFAEKVMRQVSIFDLTNNAQVDDYQRFALDYDAPDAHTGGNDPTTVFVVKVDESNPDFQNERFVIRFTLVNQLRKYLRFRADLSTTDATVSPGLDSYRIKLG